MRRLIHAASLSVLVICAVCALTVGQASGAIIENAGRKSPLLAIYGFPPETEENVAKKEAIGGGLGRNFGFGENMLFRASQTVGKPIRITIGSALDRAEDTYLAGTVMSNKTGKNNPLSFTFQFADFQDNFFKEVLTPLYADTSDRPWISEICSPEVGTECHTDPLFIGPPGTVQINDVSLNIGAPAAPTVVQGTLWGKWSNGKPPCITFTLPPEKAAGDQTLIVTQSLVLAVGTKITAIEGTACLISANNDWFTTSPKEEPEIIIKNA